MFGSYTLRWTNGTQFTTGAFDDVIEVAAEVAKERTGRLVHVFFDVAGDDVHVCTVREVMGTGNIWIDYTATVAVVS